MTLFKDDDGKAYHIYSSEQNSTLYISLLSDDYLKPSGTFTRNFAGKFREAPAVFKHNGLYYVISWDVPAGVPMKRNMQWLPKF